MAKQEKMDRHLRCSFCGKSRDEVRKLIAGPTVYICDECVNLCNDIIAEDWEEAKEEISSKLKKPAEIKHHLDQYVIVRLVLQRNHAVKRGALESSFIHIL